MCAFDTLYIFLICSSFSTIFNTKGFRYMSYALSGAAMTVASIASYEVLTNLEILPKWTGPALAITIISLSFGYAFATRKNRILGKNGTSKQKHEEKTK